MSNYRSEDCASNLHEYCTPCQCECHKGDLMHELFDLITLMPDKQTQEIIDYIMELRAVRKMRDSLNKENNMTGMVARLVSAKNYGFIIDDNKINYFFHKDDFNGFWEDLVEDIENKKIIKVTFEPTETDKGMRAHKVFRTDMGV